jgi:outer membrane protein OmpA-like peptidoglycan-associated protein
MNTVTGKFLIIVFLITSCNQYTLLSQTKPDKDFIRAVQAADLNFYFNEDYEKAASLYEELLKSYPGNLNLAAKLGICYLNIDGKMKDALKLLENASTNVVKSDAAYLEYGQKAPLDTWFYLAHAYHVNNDLSKAIQLYNDVMKKMPSGEVLRVEYIECQIKACKYATEMEKTPADVTRQLFLPWLSSWPGASMPVISANDSVFVFTQKVRGKNHIFCSYNTGGWETPIDITSQLGQYDNIETNSITRNGDLLILYMDDGADGNLYSSSRKGSRWSGMRKLNKNINTKYWEAFGFITPDGNQIFFSSNRPGGFGELDIYVSRRDANGNWGEVSNPGRTINTPYNENTPFFDPVTGTLLFSSVGHNGMGGYDLFSSTLKEGKWTEAVGMPYPLNTTSDDKMFLNDPGGKGLLTSLVDDKSGVRNIYRIIREGAGSDSIVTNGNLVLQDGMSIESELAEIKFTTSDSVNGWKKIGISDSGKYNFTGKPGDYLVQIKYPGYKTDTLNLIIPKNFTGKSLVVNTSLIPEKVYSGDFFTIRNILFDYDKYSLNDRSLFELAKLKSILSDQPELKIEVSGYTDSKGSKEYNLLLADRRAQSVINYFTSAGIQDWRFIKKVSGASDFIAINSNPDGSDNPEGRQINRRVIIGVVNPQTGISIRQESYTPPGLREPSSMKYRIVLLKSPEKFYPDYFREFNLNELLFVCPVFRDSLYFYMLGDFTSRSQAGVYLDFVREKGFKTGYIVNQYDVQEPPLQLMNKSTKGRISGSINTYTIQLRASASPLQNNNFKSIEGVQEIKGKDGLFRYIMGEYEGFSKAKEALENVHRSGYTDAFIKEYNLLMRQ